VSKVRVKLCSNHLVQGGSNTLTDGGLIEVGSDLRNPFGLAPTLTNCVYPSSDGLRSSSTFGTWRASTNAHHVIWFLCWQVARASRWRVAAPLGARKRASHA
jgi:hypothetical protein